MTRAPLSVRAQQALLVEKDGAQRLAYWVEYAIGARVRTLAAVIEPVRTLLPRFGAGLGFADHTADLPRVELRGWLAARGYRVLGSTVDDAGADPR